MRIRRNIIAFSVLAVAFTLALVWRQHPAQIVLGAVANAAFLNESYLAALRLNAVRGTAVRYRLTRLWRTAAIVVLVTEPVQVVVLLGERHPVLAVVLTLFTFTVWRRFRKDEDGWPKTRTQIAKAVRALVASLRPGVPVPVPTR